MELRYWNRLLCPVHEPTTSSQNSGPRGKPFAAAPLPEWDARFSRTEGWTGRDGAFSAALGDRILRLFGDSCIGQVIDGAYHGARIVRNTIAIQPGDDFAIIERELVAVHSERGV